MPNNLTGTTVDMDGTDAFAKGASDASTGGNPDKAREYADVAEWTKEVRQSEKFDEYARREYGLNRKHLKGHRGKYTVAVPIAAAYVDVLQSFIFARNPSVNCGASELTEPPPQKQILSMVLEKFQSEQDQQYQRQRQAAEQAKAQLGNADPAMIAKLQQLGQSVLQKANTEGQSGTLPPQPPGPDGLPQQPAPLDENDPIVKDAVAKLLAPYQKQRDDAKQFAQTMEIVITHFWDKAMLKERAKLMVKSGISLGPGWIKAFWLERMGEDPVTVQQIRDLKEQIAQIKAAQTELAEGEAKDPDAEEARLLQLINGLQQKVDVVVARGFVVDFVAAEDIQVSTEVPQLSQYRDARWLCHRSWPTIKQAKEEYPDIADKIEQSATRYFPRKPDINRDRDSAYAERQYTEDAVPSGKDADYYVQGQEASSSERGGKPVLCRREIWDLTTGNVITLIDGLQCYAKEPYVPEVKSTRGHPFFQFGVGYIDGERHAFSLISRSEQLFDEYNAVRSNYREARRRAIPKTGYNATGIEKEEIDKLAGATIGEMVGLKMVNPNGLIKDVLAPITYNAIDPALFDTSVIRAELEQIWGIQEALSSTIRTPKTATEASIQQQGTQSRTGYMSDDLDAMFTDLAQYTAEVLLQVLSEEDVREIAGPFALWEPALSLEDMGALITVGIDAGSAGKPMTQIEQQTWANILPVLFQKIEEIGALRGSSKEDIADCIEAVVQETIRRAGDRADVSQFLPDPPRTPPPPPPPQGTPPPLANSALQGQQITALVQIATDLNMGKISAKQAEGLIDAAAPNVPQQIIDKIVKGSMPVTPEPSTDQPQDATASA